MGNNGKQMGNRKGTKGNDYKGQDLAAMPLTKEISLAAEYMLFLDPFNLFIVAFIKNK